MYTSKYVAKGPGGHYLNVAPRLGRGETSVKYDASGTGVRTDSYRPSLLSGPLLLPLPTGPGPPNTTWSAPNPPPLPCPSASGGHSLALSPPSLRGSLISPLWGSRAKFAALMTPFQSGCSVVA